MCILATKSITLALIPEYDFSNLPSSYLQYIVASATFCFKTLGFSIPVQGLCISFYIGDYQKPSAPARISYQSANGVKGSIDQFDKCQLKTKIPTDTCTLAHV